MRATHTAGASTALGPLEVVCCDLDGVVWRGEEPIVGAADALARLRGAGLRVAFMTNNSHPTHEEQVAKLRGLGIAAGADEILSSADAAADLLAAELAPGSRVHVAGGPGLRAALEAVGLCPVGEGDAREPPEAVVVGWHRFDFAGLDRAAAAVRAGARFVATNVDATYPTPEGLLPGAGAIVAAVATAAGREPVVAGKPAAPSAALVASRLGGAGIVVGDRPSTDGALAARLGWPFALVLSGVTSPEGGPGRERIPDPPPALVAEDLGALAARLLEGDRVGEPSRPQGR